MKNKSKRLFLLVSSIVIFVMLTMMITNGFKDWNPYGWFDKKDSQATEVQPSESLQVDTYNSPLMKMDARAIEPTIAPDWVLQSEELESLDYYYDSDSELIVYRFEATVLPTDASNKEVTWSIAWEDPSDSWAYEMEDDFGRYVENYACILPDSSNSQIAYFVLATGSDWWESSNKNVAIEEEIIITAKSVVNSSAKATCKVEFGDLIDRFENWTVNTSTSIEKDYTDSHKSKMLMSTTSAFNRSVMSFADIYYTKFECSLSREFTSYKVEVKANEAFATAFNSQYPRLAMVSNQYVELSNTNDIYNAIIFNLCDSSEMMDIADFSAVTQSVIDILTTLGTREVGTVCVTAYSSVGRPCIEEIPLHFADDWKTVNVSSLQLNEIELII